MYSAVNEHSHGTSPFLLGDITKMVDFLWLCWFLYIYIYVNFYKFLSISTCKMQPIFAVSSLLNHHLSPFPMQSSQLTSIETTKHVPWRHKQKKRKKQSETHVKCIIDNSNLTGPRAPGKEKQQHNEQKKKL